LDLGYPYKEEVGTCPLMSLPLTDSVG
jgi:hypothetical protein